MATGDPRIGQRIGLGLDLPEGHAFVALNPEDATELAMCLIEAARRLERGA